MGGVSGIILVSSLLTVINFLTYGPNTIYCSLLGTLAVIPHIPKQIQKAMKKFYTWFKLHFQLNL